MEEKQKHWGNERKRMKKRKVGSREGGSKKNKREENLRGRRRKEIR